MPNAFNGTRFFPRLSRVVTPTHRPSSTRGETSVAGTSGGTLPTNPFIGPRLRPRILENLVSPAVTPGTVIGDPAEEEWSLIGDCGKDGKEGDDTGKEDSKEGNDTGKEGVKDGDDSGKEASDPDDLGARMTHIARVRFSAPMM